MITRAIKEQEVKSLGEKFAKAKAAFIVDFKGMKVEQVTDLRKKLHPTESEMCGEKYPCNTSTQGSPRYGESHWLFIEGDECACVCLR